MSNIRIRRFASTSEGDAGWEMDCIVLPDDEMNGELIQYELKKTVDFRGESRDGLYAALDDLLDRVAEADDIPRDQVRLVIGRLKNEQRTHYSLKASGQYFPSSPESDIWNLVDSVFEERMETNK